MALLLPVGIAVYLEYEQAQNDAAMPKDFPVTVDPENKTIVENTQVNALLEGPHSPLQAAAGNTQGIVDQLLTWIASDIAEAPWYQGIAAVDGHFVVVKAGMRKEQVARAFGIALDWNESQKQKFLTPQARAELPLSEGSFSPGIYLLNPNASPMSAQTLVNKRFSEQVLAHYGSSTAERVPLKDALTIASLIERETGGPEDMRLISGIIWNRLFLGMNLQIDATVQYAKAGSPSVTSWWPRIGPGDQFRPSAYNTYLHPGLPPGPIATPSVAAVIAALNPKNTSCLFYFHDAAGEFHCSETYKEHVALLKKYYGRGK